jgi:hypothetical protein
MGGACGTHGRENSAQGLGGIARSKETTKKTEAWMGGWEQNGS